MEHGGVQLSEPRRVVPVESFHTGKFGFGTFILSEEMA